MYDNMMYILRKIMEDVLESGEDFVNSTNDLTGFMQTYLLENNFDKLTFYEKKNVILEGIRKYVYRILQNSGINISSTSALFVLMDKLYHRGNFKEGEYAVDAITLYLLQMISMLQESPCDWYQLEDFAFVKHPFMQEEDGVVKRFVSHEKTFPLLSFDRVYNYFKDDFCLKKEKKRIFTKKW